MKKLNVFFLVTMLVFGLVSCESTKKNAENGRDAVELSGAGATFPLPFYNVIFENFAEVNGDVVAYGGIGSASPHSGIGYNKTQETQKFFKFLFKKIILHKTCFMNI